MWKRAVVWALPLPIFVTVLIGAAVIRIPVPPQDYQNCLQAAQQSGNKETGCRRYETIWQRGLSDPVAYYTLWLTLFTGALAIVSGFQLWFLRRADETARVSADAAKLAADAANKSANAALAVEMPLVFLDQIDLVTPQPPLGPDPRQTVQGIPPALTTIKMVFKNYGRTPARVVSVHFHHRVIRELPPLYAGGRNENRASH